MKNELVLLQPAFYRCIEVVEKVRCNCKMGTSGNKMVLIEEVNVEMHAFCSTRH